MLSQVEFQNLIDRVLRGTRVGDVITLCRESQQLRFEYEKLQAAQTFWEPTDPKAGAGKKKGKAGPKGDAALKGTEPWVEAGVSRASWYRRQKGKA